MDKVHQLRTRPSISPACTTDRLSLRGEESGSLNLCRVSIKLEEDHFVPIDDVSAG